VRGLQSPTIAVHEHDKNIKNAVTVNIKSTELRAEEKEGDRTQENLGEAGCDLSHAHCILHRLKNCKKSDHHTSKLGVFEKDC
jgi:hypothetical protein